MLASQQPQQWSNQIDSSNTTSNYDRPPRSASRKNNSEGRSLLTGPIPPTSDYEYDDRITSAPYDGSRGIARVHGSDAKAIHKRATNGTGVPFIFEIQGSGLLPNHGSAAKPPRNHLNENIRRMRRVMRDSRQRQSVKDESKPKPVKELWHSKQYDHVQSKVKQKLDEETHRSSSRPQSARPNFLQAHANTGPEHIRCRSAAGSRPVSRASSVDLTVTQNDNTTKPDYIKINSQWVKSIPKVRKPLVEETVAEVRSKYEKDLKEYHKKQKGRVPDYIEKIKEQRTQELYNERAHAPDPDCPIGHVRLDEEKRLSTLRQLEHTRAEFEKKMSHLPIRNDSLTLRRAKEELEKKIIEADEAIKIFSKSKVFVRLEE